MPLNKKWIEIGDRRESEYVRGIGDFLNYAFQRSAVSDR